MPVVVLLLVRIHRSFIEDSLTRNNRNVGNVTGTLQCLGICFSVTLAECAAKKLLNRFQVTESFWTELL